MSRGGWLSDLYGISGVGSASIQCFWLAGFPPVHLISFFYIKEQVAYGYSDDSTSVAVVYLQLTDYSTLRVSDS